MDRHRAALLVAVALAATGSGCGNRTAKGEPTSAAETGDAATADSIPGDARSTTSTAPFGAVDDAAVERAAERSTDSTGGSAADPAGDDAVVADPSELPANPPPGVSEPAAPTAHYSLTWERGSRGAPYYDVTVHLIVRAHGEVVFAADDTTTIGEGGSGGVAFRVEGNVYDITVECRAGTCAEA